MIQRVQTLWLLIASAFAFITMKFAFFVGTNTKTLFNEFNATNNIILLILSSILGALCLFTIFIFKQRKLQLWLCILAIAISGLDIYLYFVYKKDYPSSNLTLTSVFAFAIPIFLILAARGIYKDQKLVKSMDRLR
jgi:Domain of unknown function (DUF4293)